MASLKLAPRTICLSGELIDGGRGVRFAVDIGGTARPAFAIRYAGQVHAYLNECAHRHVELDWNEGEFFDRDREFLVCATHGARYRPESGACAGGPCNGASLVKLAVSETEGCVVLHDANTLDLAAEVRNTG